MISHLTEIFFLLILLLLRLWSSHEHRSNKKDVQEIKIFFNGEMQRRLEQAKEEGRQEERLKQQKTNL